MPQLSGAYPWLLAAKWHCRKAIFCPCTVGLQQQEWVLGRNVVA